jgi:polysaccharide biosynthesis/export protein
MGTKRLFKLHTRFVLLASLVLTISHGWGAVSTSSAEKSDGATAVVQAQGGKESAGQQNTSNPKRVVDDYRIGAADVLAINVWKDAELSRTVTVRPDGKISLPLVGEIEVNGLTASAVQRLISQRLVEYVSNPQVTVVVQEVKSQTYIIVGKVSKPGSYDLGRPTTILQAIAIAGGFLDFAKPGKVRIMRHQDGGPSETFYFDYNKVIKGKNNEQNILLKDGDTIVVP